MNAGRPATHAELCKAAGIPAHTPGPWKHQPRARDGHADIITDQRGREFAHIGSPIAETPVLDYPHENQQTANARLIASAPELLAAAELVCANMYDRDESHDDDGNETEEYSALRAAIAKAKGDA